MVDIQKEDIFLRNIPKIMGFDSSELKNELGKSYPAVGVYTAHTSYISNWKFKNEKIEVYVVDTKKLNVFL